MGMITAMFDNSAYNYEDAFGTADCTSVYMKQAIKEWFTLYFDMQPTESSNPHMRIPFTVVNKLVKTVFGEYKASGKDVFVEKIIKELDKKKSAVMQQAMIGGECLVKPVPMGDHFIFTVVSRNNLLVFGRDAEGRLTDVGTAERTIGNKSYYTLLERRTVDERGYLTIQNKLYRSDNTETLGVRVPLTSLLKYAELPDMFTYSTPVHSVGLVPVRMPMTNCVDGGSDAVSVYAPAVGLIKSININEAQIDGEFKRGESRVFASADLLKKDKSGRRHFDGNLFVGLDEDPETVGVTIFSPELREQSFLARKQDYLRAVETVCGLKRGLISEVEAAERTATEITSSAGDYNLTIIDLQGMWEMAVKDVIRLCGVLGKIYRVSTAHDVADDEVTIDWGNGILFDEDKTWSDYKAMVAAGLLKPEIAVGWRFGMPTENERDLQKVRERYMPVVEEMTEDVDDADA